MPRKSSTPSLADRNAAQGGVSAVDRALSLLDAYSPARPLLTLAELGVRLHGLATWWDVLEAAKQTGRLSTADQAAVRAFLEDPEGWSNAKGGKEPAKGSD